MPKKGLRSLPRNMAAHGFLPRRRTVAALGRFGEAGALGPAAPGR